MNLGLRAVEDQTNDRVHETGHQHMTCFEVNHPKEEFDEVAIIYMIFVSFCSWNFFYFCFSLNAQVINRKDARHATSIKNVFVVLIVGMVCLTSFWHLVHILHGYFISNHHQKQILYVHIWTTQETSYRGFTFWSVLIGQWSGVNYELKLSE